MRASPKTPRETLPEPERFCWPCGRTPIQRTEKPTPGLKTWHCPTCHRIYSDAHRLAFATIYDRRDGTGRFQPKDNAA